MPGFFPVKTVAFKLDEARAFRRLSFSVLEMAVVTGVVLRVYRALALSLAGANAALLVASFAVGFVVLFGMVTLHLGNFTVRRWVWRAPLFAAIEAAAESLTSLGLIAIHREPLGSTRAAFADWPGIVASIFTWRISSIVLFALVLAGVIQLARMALGDETSDGREMGDARQG
ncbi:MAG: hypothetical protein HUU26_05595 [Gemmatimonadaceae bacterium]|nr:hypothetical protein [Gemmatimonadaceae bacterium]